MSRERHKAAKLHSGKNTPEENESIAKLGHFSNSPIAIKIHLWRWRAALYRFLATNPGKGRPEYFEKKLNDLQREVGVEFTSAIFDGNAQLIREIADGLEFFNERVSYNASNLFDFSKIMCLDTMIPVDPLRSLIVREYFLTDSAKHDRIRSTRASFQKHIESLLPDAVESRTFSRALKELGISFEKSKDN